jgi:hypothetical protein
MRKTKIEATKIIFIVKALTIIISNTALIVKDMKDLNMIDVAYVKTIKKKKLSKIDSPFLSIGRYKFIFNICYIYNIVIIKICQC